MHHKPSRDLFAGAVFFASCFASPCLPDAYAQVGIGVWGGVARTEINSADDESLNVRLRHKNGLAAGVFFELPITRNLWVQPELLVNARGTQWEVNGARRSVDLLYLDVPIVLRYAGPESGRSKIHVFGGGYVGRLLQGTSEGSAGGSVDVSGRLETLDWGWLAGVGTSFGDVRVDLRYNVGVRDITAGDGLDDVIGRPAESAPTAYRNRGFLLLGGYRF